MSILVRQHLPSLRALRASDERLLAEELRVLATKQQIAVVRTPADELERCLVRGGAPLAVQGQLVEELARLGCRSETAAANGGENRGPRGTERDTPRARVRGFVSADRGCAAHLLRCHAVALVLT
jgi:hypothetical protein